MAILNLITERISISEKEWKQIRGEWFSGDTQKFINWMRSFKKISISRVTVGNAINRNIATFYLWECLREYLKQRA